MLEEEFRVDNQNDSRENSESEIQVDNFSKTTKLLDKKLKDKKDNILKVLEKWNLKDLFERLLLSDTEDKRKCIEELLTCENDEIKIKEVILANLPDWYAYNVSTNEVVKTEEKKDNDYIWATIMDQKTEQAKTDTEQAVETKRLGESILVMRQAIEERDKLVAKYQSLDAKTNQNSGNFQTVKQKLENNWTLNQLRQNHDEQFINDYILVQTTLQELKSNPTDYEQNDISYFDKIVKNLNNACNVPDTNLNSFSSENISQTRTELFHSEVWNDGLIQARDKNLESRDYANIFPEMRDEDLIAKYGNFLEWNLKTFWQNYKNNPNEIKNKVNEIKNNPNPTDEDKRFLQIYNYMIAELDKKRKETEEQTKNMIEELCIISQIKWMYMCMWEWADFNLNKAREIESENWILTLRGHIDWVEFAIRQDTNNPEARLQTSQKLARSPDGNTFSIGWKNKDNFVDSNFILPSQDEILDSIKETVKTDSSLVDFDNQSDYLENLQSNIMSNIDDKYKDTEYVHHYMQWQVGWEKVIDNALWLINKAKQNITDNETLMKGINQATNKDLFDFIKILKFNIDNSTNTEKDNLNKCITKIIEITDNYKDTNGREDFVSLKYPPVIENYLKDKAWLNWWNEDLRLKMLSDLFKFYSEKSRDTRSNSEWNNWWTSSKMIINDLYRDLFEFQWWGKSEVASSRDVEKKLQSNNTIAWQESENADLILENWPEW